MKTKFINGTDCEITLKEANSGIQRFLFKLGKKGHCNSSFEMELDTNATYREYHLYVIPSASAYSVTVSSDHLVDNKVITITEVQQGVFSWEGTPRRKMAKKPSEEGDLAGSSDQRQAASTKSLTRWLSKLWPTSP
jgi:hypothetical protein